MEIQVHTVVFDGLAFIRENARIFRKYLFLPVFLSIASLFLAKLPAFGLALSAVSNSFALALLGVSATRFYLLRDPEEVAEGANRPFARFFFLTFALTFMGHMAEIFQFLPLAYQGGAVLWMIIGFWVNLKVCLAFPAIAIDHPGSVWDNVKASFDWTGGYALRIIGAFLLCYSPVIFFTLTLMQIPALVPNEADFFASLPQLIFSNLLIVFSVLWSSVVLAKFYEAIVLKKNRII